MQRGLPILVWPVTVCTPGEQFLDALNTAWRRTVVCSVLPAIQPRLSTESTVLPSRAANKRWITTRRGLVQFDSFYALAATDGTWRLHRW